MRLLPPNPMPNPAAAQALLLGQDLPLGNYRALRRHGALPAPNSARAYWAAARNYRTWAVFALYGFSFGVELTMNNGGAGRGAWQALLQLPAGQGRPSTATRQTPLAGLFDLCLQCLPSTFTTPLTPA